MSIEALNWALTTAPIPTDRKDASALAVVLIGLANHADPTGADAFPSVDRLMQYGRVSRRTVQRSLRALEELGLIRPGDTRYRDAKISRADQRPQAYDLALSTGLSTGHATGRQDDTPLTSTGRQQRPNGASAGTRRGVMLTPEPSFNHQGTSLRERAPIGAPAETGDPCGQCDARPGDSIAARQTTGADGRAVKCPNCHPHAAGGAL